MSHVADSLWSPISGGITTPRGYKASGIAAGLKDSGKRDLALLVAPKGAVCAGSFTQSITRAACIDLCRERLSRSKGRIRAVLINSGQANACTGDRGSMDALKASEAIASKLNFTPDEVLISSTGVIGVPIPLEKLISSLDELVHKLSFEGGDFAANAILTTDLVEKQIAYKAHFDGRTILIGGMAKGSGMIHPNMATMLGYLTCDVAVPPLVWKKMIQNAVRSSFNSITVDGDTSTNDSFVAFASGEELPTKYFSYLEEGLKLTTQYLAKSIARDGEGANCLIEVKVEGANSDIDAHKLAKTICSSSLVKTAIHGKDPNWGRIIAAAGMAKVDFIPDDVGLWFGPYQIMDNGKPLLIDKKIFTDYIAERMNGEYMRNDSVVIRLSVGKGDGSATAWGCDLSDQYVRINSDYTT